MLLVTKFSSFLKKLLKCALLLHENKNARIKLS